MKDNCIICCAIIDEPIGTPLCSIECKEELVSRSINSMIVLTEELYSEDSVREAEYRAADYI